MRARVDAKTRGPRKRVRHDESTGIVFAAVDAVGIAGDGMNAGQPVQRDGERQKELGIASAAAFAAHCDRGFAAGNQGARRGRAI